ncbi:Uncharacterised protein [Enterobacter cloacae]|nr:Uncharacterised protein [Enterobacter cloacae]
MERNNLLRLAPLLLMLSLSISGCNSPSSVQSNSSPEVKPAAYPPLPQNGRQEPIPPFCLPSCTENLTKERASSLNMLTGQESEG